MFVLFCLLGFKLEGKDGKLVFIYSRDEKNKRLVLKFIEFSKRV